MAVGEYDFVFVVDAIDEVTRGVCPSGYFSVRVGVREWSISCIIGSGASVGTIICLYGFSEWL